MPMIRNIRGHCALSNDTFRKVFGIMRKRISLLFCVVILLVSLMTIGVAASVYEPDNHGTYTVSLDMQPESEYIMLVVKGHYDQTNYIEAYSGADDAEILYYEQKASDKDGSVSFGPFVPNGYYDSTVIVGGTNLDLPYLAGYLSVDGVSNSADITVSGLEQSYTVAGNFGFDYNVVLGAEVFDSFGYPSVTNEEVNYELLNNLEGVTLEGNVLNISKYAKAQAFILRASAGDAVENVYVQIKRETPVHEIIKVYLDEECEDSVDFIEVKGVIGNFEPITVYVKTFDQFGDEIADTYNLRYGGKAVSQTFTPYLGSSNLEIYSNNSAVSAYVMVNAVSRPDYQGTANDLFALINNCKDKLGEEKHISVDGKDVFPGSKWTKQENVDAFSSAIGVAEAALNEYGKDGYSDADYSDEAEALNKALSTYEASFKDGIRRDVDTVSLKEYDGIIMENSETVLEAVVSPKIGSGLANDVLTWTSSDESIISVESVSGSGNTKATIKGKASGKATITATTRGGLTVSAEITVVKKTLSLTLTSNVSATIPVATYGSDPVILKAKDGTKGSTDIITWTVANPDILDLSYNEYIDDDGFRWIEATVIPKSAGTTKVTVSAQFGEKSATKNVTVKMPDWQTAAAPVASVESGSILPGTLVTLTCAEGTSIYYTLDGTTPSKTNGRLYAAPFAINQSLTLKAVAVGKELYDSEVVTYEYIAVNTGVSVSSAIVKPAETTVVSINASGFENVDTAEIELEMPSDFSLESFESDYNVTVIEKSGSVLAITYEKSDKNLADGKLVTLKLVADADATEGKYTVSVVKADIHSSGLPVYTAAITDGVISVINYRIGDVNNDGVIGLADVMLLKQYLAGNENAKKLVILNASDVDNDGDIDNDDVTLLSRYCVGWSVTLG